jgi:arylsulfatase A-like enzyme
MNDAAPPPSIGRRLREDVKRAAALALVGVAAVAVVELAISLFAGPGGVSIPAIFGFIALDVSLMGLAWLPLWILTSLVLVAIRGIWAAVDREGARAWRGLGTGASERGLQPAAPWVWTCALAALIYIVGSIGATLYFLGAFKAHLAIAASLALVQIVLAGAAVAAGVALLVGFRAAARALEPRTGSWNPFGRVRIAFASLVVLLVPPLLLARRLPALRDAFPWRTALALGVFAAAVLVVAPIIARRGGLLPRDGSRRRIVLGSSVAGYVILAALSLTVIGADDQVKVMATVPRTPLDNLVRLVRLANDFDGDGYGTLLGEGDCAPFDGAIHPNNRDVPDNGIDENCNGRDSTAKGLPSWKSGEKAPVPDEFARGDWNFLLVTIDTVRYDHTTMGGYEEKKGRDTTPNLAKLAARGVSFTFANAPSAGTMASVPAIVISKFFHSGIALGPERRPKPPKILPANTTVAELLKQKGYRTGAILSHEYFNDWGLEQGIDDYDNSLGEKADPMRITSDEITTRAQAWIAKQGEQKWFLWLHYIDPHGRYVPHPGEIEYGTSEEDLYDGELAYTDKHLGRLLDWLERSNAGKRTIIFVTSDHGDGFNEHGFINHGMALYRELLHVPLIAYVPEIEPRAVDGPVSPIDIVPTIADLAGVDTTPLGLEGESLVPQIFYDKDARERVVFAETNFPDPQRAAITKDHKLIYNLKTNVYQLFDLRTDPWEKKNVYKTDKAAAEKMKALLDEWLDRVYFSRDPSSQAMQKRANVLLAGPPSPKNPARGTFGDAVEVLGWETAKDAYAAGEAVKLTVYFKSVKATQTVFKIEVEAAGLLPEGTPAPRPARQERNPADGTFPTSKWRPGEYLKETFTLKLPRDWQATRMRFGLRFLDEKRQPAVVTGAETAENRVILGEMDVTPAPARPPPPTPIPRPKPR